MSAVRQFDAEATCARTPTQRSSGDRQARRNATPQNNRFKRVFEELATIGISAEPAVYADEMASEVREQLLLTRQQYRRHPEP